MRIAITCLAAGIALAAIGFASADEAWAIGLSVVLVLAGIAGIAVWRRKQRTLRRELVHRIIDEELIPMPTEIRRGARLPTSAAHDSD